MTVTNDSAAFQEMRDRLAADVGPVFELARDRGKTYTPNFLLVRAMLPIAEAVGDLLYQRNPTDNLKEVLRNEFVRATGRTIYKDLTGTIASLYRHALIHTDAPRSVRVGSRVLAWRLDALGTELELRKQGTDDYALVFGLVGFFEDLKKVLDAQIVSATGTTGITTRYSSWPTLDLTTTPKAEIAVEILALP